MFPIEDLRQAVETAKRILTKEKLDRQLTGQTSTSPFKSIKDGFNRKVSFNTRDELGDEIDKLRVMLGKLAAKDNNNKRSFKPKYIKVEDLFLKVKTEVTIREFTKVGTD